ncbi:MAG: hypothetical protein ACLS48_09780 [[Eubacterium] siraeum]
MRHIRLKVSRLNLGLENLYKAAYKVTEALRQKTDKTTRKSWTS